MNSTTQQEYRLIDLAEGGKQKTLQTLGRGLTRRCPYCGGDQIFKSWFSLKDRCPHCNTLFAYEDGYFLGSYVINLGLTSLIAVGLVIWMLTGTDLSVLQMQITGVVIAVALPLILFPFSLSFWMTLDLLVHPDYTDRPRM